MPYIECQHIIASINNLKGGRHPSASVVEIASISIRFALMLGAWIRKAHTNARTGFLCL